MGVMSDEASFGGGYWLSYNNPSCEEILNNPMPPEPVFEEDLQPVRTRVEKLVGKARFPKNLQQPHRFVARLLQQNQERIQKKLQSRWPSIFDDPWFDSPFEQRRLKIINALYTALESCGFHPSSTRKEGRDLGVKVGDQRINFTIDDVNVKDDNNYLWLARDKKPASTKMRFRILSCFVA